MSKHTPGPWFVTGMNDTNVSAMGSDDLPTLVAQRRAHKLTADANARLIAAAPDLLASLRDLVAHREHLLACGESELNPVTLQRAADAIAKATGAA
jgi:hypothetical protein